MAFAAEKASPVTQEPSTANASAVPPPSGSSSPLAVDAADTKGAPSTANGNTTHPQSTTKTPHVQDASGAPKWPELAADHPLSQFLAVLDEIVAETGHNEVFGVNLAPPNFQTNLILQKFLRANQNNLEHATGQLRETLKWRKEFEPLKAMGEVFSKARFDNLGHTITVEKAPASGAKEVATFNLYGTVKDYEKTFGDLDQFIRWRVGLMELSLTHLHLPTATTPIPDYGRGPDPYQGIQVHDYRNVSFIRMDARAKAASRTVIRLMSAHYPETMARKYFVNVPFFMGWVYTAAKAVLSVETARKFVVLSDGKQLVTELGDQIPASYGGKEKELDVIGRGLKLED